MILLLRKRLTLLNWTWLLIETYQMIHLRRPNFLTALLSIESIEDSIAT